MMESTCIRTTEISEDIVLITMCDEINKNTFTNEMMEQLISAFERIDNSNYKVVVLTGYNNYFSSGGSKEGLLDIQKGCLNFNNGGEKNIYSLLLRCKIPAIAAMQGHGIGGGFALGLSADIVVLSRESIYTSNFMKYGFTPGMGATLILPEKLGAGLANEMLFRANSFSGEELKRRGVPFAVLPRSEVLEYSISIAQELAQKPRGSLMLLKKHMVKNLMDRLPQYIDDEIEMHNKTFHTEEVRARIEMLFGK